MEASTQASQACRTCRQLKRRCTKELPSCSLCVRLHKNCRYPTKPRQLEPEDLDRQELVAMVHQLRGRVQQHEPRSVASPDVDAGILPCSAASPYATISQFPLAFFLDPDFHSPISQAQQPISQAAPDSLTSLIGSHARSICDEYFASTHLWLPILSSKRLYRSIENVSDGAMAVLVLCMKLVSTTPDPFVSPSDSVLYRLAKQYVSALQDSSAIPLSLLQSVVLIAAYEVGHALLPAAYVTVGQTARLGIIMGLHCWNSQTTTQLYKPSDSWTLCEERRRTWWAIFVLDRLLNIGPRGLPLAVPEPNRGDLLPSDDTAWNTGGIGLNEPVYTAGYSQTARVGAFARTCQASHMLGRVLRHRDEANEDHQAQLSEASKLHSALVALDGHLTEAQAADNAGDAAVKNLTSLGLCCSARLTLYDLYSCNKPSLRKRVAQESEMQALSLDGAKTVAGERVPAMAREILSYDAGELTRVSPLVIQCLYHAATECQWFIKEELGADMEASLQLLTASLTHLGQRWKIAGIYVEFLSREDAT